ncbi:winged helix-turn-helix transcriptional regulator [Palleniella intestinalis]|jgi:Predicted transcriptional regulator containing an HTH domain and an uncharacterized domain shared with the mammalian protein Schlafen|uniref:winged helix-turn-helix transcriptional regulator n=1 Tax=Palleniella intestinalis TaxID=2736291 RepID=UPI0020A699D2|nr:winged helix-turn-helix transcriptional regulator [Palleniella intestinalis]
MSLNLNSNMTVADCGQLSFSAKNTKKVLISDQKATRKRPENSLQEQEDAIVELILVNPYISRKEIARQLDMHDSSVKRRLASLQDRNVIRRVGAAKGGYWQVIK